MATLRTSAVRDLFPLTCADDVVRLFRQHMLTTRTSTSAGTTTSTTTSIAPTTMEPDLTLLSIVTGLIENTLCGRCAAAPQQPAQQQQPATPTTPSTTRADITGGLSQASADAAASAAAGDEQQVSSSSSGNADEQPSTFPHIQLSDVTALYDKFEAILSLVEPVPNCPATSGASGSSNGPTRRQQQQQQTAAPPPRKFASRELIKRVSDIVWNSLIRSTYKDRAHLQSLYSYLAAGKLDCFGMALAVVAGCQRLGYADVRLAISEDHAWVVFGPSGTDTIEVTWHGKGTEDKRGQPATTGYQSRSWLYLAGHPVVCRSRAMEVAAIVSAINPSMNVTTTCSEVADLQQQLLWLLYDQRHLQRYPMALGCLGELEEVRPTAGRPSCERLYAQSVRAARLHYRNHHVYPYTFQGVYYYRQSQYKDAFSAWANAGDVIRLYNYSRDDEEIYKEFLDIANEHIPWIMKTESSGHSARSVLRDPQCFANLLRFYDGICQWEEGSPTPILHIGWAKPLVTTISRFDCDIRSQVIIELARDSDDVHKCAEAVSLAERALAQADGELWDDPADPAVCDAFETNNNNNNNNNDGDAASAAAADGWKTILAQPVAGQQTSATAATAAAVAATPVISSLEALTAACGEKILNPDFLLQGGGQPFADQLQTPKSDEDAPHVDELKLNSSIKAAPAEAAAVNSPLTPPSSSPSASPQSPPPPAAAIAAAPTKIVQSAAAATTTTTTTTTIMVPTYTPPLDIIEPVRPTITLYSRKMKGIRDLLVAEKLNTHAISLQVTAQSQVQVVGKKGRSLASSVSYAAKRTRRQ